MEIIFQKTIYESYVRRTDADFSGAPCVVLYSYSTREYFTATCTKDTNRRYKFAFGAATTGTMPRGMYRLEIYEDATMVKLFRSIDHFAEVRTGAAAVAEHESD